MKQRHPKARDLYKNTVDKDGNKLCAFCSRPVAKKRDRFCSQACQEEVKIRCYANYARKRVEERDHGVCAECGMDTVYYDKLRSEVNYEPQRGCRTTDATIIREWNEWNEKYRVPIKCQTPYYGRHLWEADHIRPVVFNGGACGLDNLQTLCIACHLKCTAELAGQRSRKPKKPYHSVV